MRLFRPYPEEACLARRLEGWMHGTDLQPSFETRASFDKLRSALLRMRPRFVDALEISQGGVVRNEAFISGHCLRQMPKDGCQMTDDRELRTPTSAIRHLT